jgi:hypothetical protein
MKNKVYIEITSSLDHVEYDIVYAHNGNESTLARTWDYQLAERIRDTVEDYMKSEYKVNPELPQ